MFVSPSRFLVSTYQIPRTRQPQLTLGIVRVEQDHVGGEVLVSLDLADLADLQAGPSDLSEQLAVLAVVEIPGLVFGGDAQDYS